MNFRQFHSFDLRVQSFGLRDDIVVSATEAWSGRISAKVDTDVLIMPPLGVIVAVNARLTNMAINRFQPAVQGDIVAPHCNFSIMGTSIWLADEPDVVEISRDHIQKLVGLILLSLG